jgi:hypothetical protein
MRILRELELENEKAGQELEDMLKSAGRVIVPLFSILYFCSCFSRTSYFALTFHAHLTFSNLFIPQSKLLRFVT